MTTPQWQSQVSFDALVAGAEQLNTSDLERFANQVLVIRARRRAPNLSPKESELLQKINQGLPGKIEQRFQLLRNEN